MASSDETFKAFEVPYDDNRPSSNLQDAFKKYRSKKQVGLAGMIMSSSCQNYVGTIVCKKASTRWK